jgi:hypothetical protein
MTMVDDRNGIFIPSVQKSLPVDSYVLLSGGEKKVVKLIGYNKDEGNAGFVDCTVLELLMQPPPLQQTSVLIEHIQELNETSTTIAVPANEIEEVAFVFHPEHLIQEAFSAFGIFNFFLCRFKRDQSTSSLQELSKEDINPFSSRRIDVPLQMWSLPHCASYSRVIFDDLLSFQDGLWRIFNYTSQKQAHVCRNGDKVRVQMETWEYMCRNLSRKLPNLSFVACTTKNLRRNTSSGGRRSTQRKLRAATKCVLLTEEELSAFAAIVGPSTLSGVRKMRPSVAVAYQDLLENDLMNVVRHLSPEDDESDPRLCRRRGVSLTYDGFYLYFNINYISYIYAGPTAPCPNGDLKYVLSFASPPGQQRRNEEQEEKSEDEGVDAVSLTNRLFQHDGNIYKVLEVNPAENLCLCEVRDRRGKLARHQQVTIENLQYIAEAVSNYN